MWAGHGAWGAWPIQQSAFANIPSEEGRTYKMLFVLVAHFLCVAWWCNSNGLDW